MTQPSTYTYFAIWSKGHGSSYSPILATFSAGAEIIYQTLNFNHQCETQDVVLTMKLRSGNDFRVEGRNNALTDTRRLRSGKELQPSRARLQRRGLVPGLAAVDGSARKYPTHDSIYVEKRGRLTRSPNLIGIQALPLEVMQDIKMGKR